MRHPYFDVPTPTPIGHRGACGELPENTLESFERAVTDGVTIVETDVHATRDGHVVIFHDATLDRTTDASGPVAARTLEELRALDAGYRFSPDGGGRFPFRGRGLRIPTLEEAFDRFPDMRFNIEIKSDTPGLLEAVVALVMRQGRADRTLLAAEKDPIMAAMRAHLNETGAPIAVGASVGDVLAFVQAAVEGKPPPSGTDALQVPPGFGGRPLVTPDFLAHARAHDIAVHVWTINERPEIDRLLDLGVDGVMSDFPARVVEALAARRG